MNVCLFVPATYSQSATQDIQSFEVSRKQRLKKLKRFDNYITQMHLQHHVEKRNKGKKAPILSIKYQMITNTKMNAILMSLYFLIIESFEHVNLNGQ